MIIINNEKTEEKKLIVNILKYSKNMIRIPNINLYISYSKGNEDYVSLNFVGKLNDKIYKKILNYDHSQYYYSFKESDNICIQFKDIPYFDELFLEVKFSTLFNKEKNGYIEIITKR